MFADGLVLQSWVEGDARSFVYGSASALAAVNVTMTSAAPAQPYEKVYSTQASSLGAWSVQLDGTYVADPQKRHGPQYGPYALAISDGEGGSHRISDVTFGDVYLCLGDAEMARRAP